MGLEHSSRRLQPATGKSHSQLNCICLDWDEVDAEELRLGISTDGYSPIYCFSWKNKTSQANISEIQTQVLAEAVLDEKPLILIVDDDPRFSQILSRILEENGFQTLVATSGKEGLEILMDFSPELVITDVHMPHLSSILCPQGK